MALIKKVPLKLALHWVQSFEMRVKKMSTSFGHLLKILLNLFQSVNYDAILNNGNQIHTSLLSVILSKLHRKPLKMTFLCF